MRSIDVSEYNGIIKWEQTAPLVEVVFVKAVGSSGTSASLVGGQSINNIDPMFKRNWLALAELPQITRGAYLYLYMSDDPETAAQQFLNTVQPGPFDLVAVDLEDQVTAAAKWMKGTGDLWPFVKSALDVIEKGIGRKPFIYTSPGWWNYYLCKVVQGVSITPPPDVAEYPLWLAHYTQAKKPQIPEGFKEWLIWQYGSELVAGCGITAGSNPNTDVDRLAIPLGDLRGLWCGTVTPPPVVELTLEQKVAILWKERSKV